MSRIEDGGAVEAGLVERLRAMAPTVGGTLSFEGRSTRAMNDDIRRAAAEITRLRAENAGMREALGAIVSALSEQDDEGLIEFAPEMQRARAALSNATTPETGGGE